MCVWERREGKRGEGGWVWGAGEGEGEGRWFRVGAISRQVVGEWAQWTSASGVMCVRSVAPQSTCNGR